MLFAAVTAGFIYGITPGPGVLAMFNVGTDRGRKAALLFLSGHFLGDVVWSMLALASIIGVTVISPIVFAFVGTISGIYLIWLGLNAIRLKGTLQSQVNKQDGSAPVLYGLVFGLSNPKAYPVAAATLTALLASKMTALSWAIMPALLAAVSCGGILAYAMLIQIVGLK